MDDSSVERPSDALPGRNCAPPRFRIVCPTAGHFHSASQAGGGRRPQLPGPASAWFLVPVAGRACRAGRIGDSVVLAVNPKIRHAVVECLELCRDLTPGQITATIRDFLKRLESSDGWQRAEIRAVESGVRRVLIFGAFDREAFREPAATV